MMHALWLWTVFTVAAAGGQTLRNAMQRELIGALGAVGATQVRFLVGLPFVVFFFSPASGPEPGLHRLDWPSSPGPPSARSSKSPPPR